MLDFADRAARAVEAGFAVGMHQHRDEVLPFATWLAQRQPHHIIEIGCLHGGTATMFHGLSTGKVITIDLPDGRFGGADHHYTREKCLDRGKTLFRECPRVRSILGDSHTVAVAEMVAKILNGDRADVLFIDGDHTYAGVRDDYELYAPLVEDGGVIAFHDILDTPLHRAAGCRVDQLWAELPGRKIVFSIDSAWGGIGVVFKGASRI